MAGNNIQGASKVEEIVNVWAKLEKIVTSNVEILERYSKSASNLPSDYVRQVEETRKAQEALNKALEEAKSTQAEYTNLVKSEERLAKKTARVKADLAKATSKESKEYHKLNEAKKLADKLNREEAKRLVATQGLYNKVQAGINSLTKKYNDLAIRKELNGKLSLEEEVALGKLEAKLNKYQGALKRVDANIGKHQRNVGNYKSGFDGLGFSVAQLSREMPAFANSMQTGFMAISNNVPMLVDEINKLRRANVELAASGKPTVSVMKSLGKAIFGWQTLISIGVTLLTVYGAKIFETIFAISEEEKALKKANDELKEQNQALADNIALRKRQLEGARGFINQSALISEFQNILNDLTKDSSRAEAVLTELSDRLDKMGIDGADSLKDQNLLASDRLVIAANLLEIEEQKIKLEEERIKNDNIQLKQKEILSDFEKGNIGELEKNRRLQNLNNVSLEETIKIQKEINRLTEANQSIIGKTADINDNGNEGKRDTLEALGFKSAEDSNKEFQEYAKKVMAVLEENFGVEAGKLDPIKLPPLDSEDFTEGLTKLQVATDSFIQNLSFSSIDNSPLSSLKTFFDGTFDDLILGANSVEEEFAITFNAIGEVAKQTFGLISELGEANFNAQYERLAKEKETALMFAGEGTAAKERIEEQYEERRIQIQNRQAKAQKDQALFNAGVTTAQSSLAAYASQLIPGDPTSIIRAQIAAAIAASFGLVQIGLIASQQVPQFKGGVRGFEGGLAVVGDGGVSEVIGTDKGFFKTPNKSTLVNLPKNADVYKSETDFNRELSNMLNLNGVMPFKESVIKDMPVIQVNNSGATAMDMDRILTKHFSNIQVNNLNFDERGIKKWVSKGNSATIIHNNRTSFKGFSV